MTDGNIVYAKGLFHPSDKHGQLKPPQAEMQAQSVMKSRRAADEIFQPPAALTVDFTIPYTMEGSKYMVPVMVQGKPFSMRLDTGCGRCIIPVDYAQSIGIEIPAREPDSHHRRLGCAIWKVSMDVQLGTLIRKAMPVAIFDTTVWPGTPILGNDFFNGYLRVLQASDKQLRVSQNMGADLDSNWQRKCVVPFRRDRHRGTPIVETVINGKTVPVLFDTGANNAIWMTYEQAAELDLEVEGTAVVVGSTKIPAVRLNVRSLKIGSVHLSNVKTVVCEKAHATWATDMICFGTAILSDCDFAIDDRSAKLHILRRL